MLTVSLGIECILKSSVIVPTTTAILLARSVGFIWRTILASDNGGLLTRLIKSLLSITLLNGESVRRAKKRYNFTKNNK